MTQRVLCYGGRTYSDSATVHGALMYLATLWGETYLIINGGARGADSLCRDWGLRRGWPVITMDAPWDAMGRAAGSVRNGWMIEYAAPTYAVGFPGGPGTADMTKRLQRAGIPTWHPVAN